MVAEKPRHGSSALSGPIARAIADWMVAAEELEHDEAAFEWRPPPFKVCYADGERALQEGLAAELHSTAAAFCRLPINAPLFRAAETYATAAVAASSVPSAEAQRVVMDAIMTCSLIAPPAAGYDRPPSPPSAVVLELMRSAAGAAMQRELCPLWVDTMFNARLELDGLPTAGEVLLYVLSSCLRDCHELVTAPASVVNSVSMLAWNRLRLRLRALAPALNSNSTSFTFADQIMGRTIVGCAWHAQKAMDEYVTHCDVVGAICVHSRPRVCIRVRK